MIKKKKANLSNKKEKIQQGTKKTKMTVIKMMLEGDRERKYLCTYVYFFSSKSNRVTHEVVHRVVNRRVFHGLTLKNQLRYLFKVEI